MAQLKIWWTEPPWLSSDKEKWPRSTFLTQPHDFPERRSKTITTIIITAQEFDIFSRYSKFTKLIRIVAYILRFLKNARQAKNSSKNTQVYSTTELCMVLPILPEERHQVLNRLVKLIQSLHFSEEFKSLTNNETVHKNSPLLKLHPFVDDFGILRVGGRLQASFLPYTAKHPILLLGHHPFSHLIVIHEHETHLHAGPQATLAAVRQKYWLTSARGIVRKIVRKCVICFRSSPKSASTIMGNLSKPRVNMEGI